MAIKFKCDCGKALSARAIYAGRKVRCPECGKKVRVPEPEEAESGDVESKRAAPHARLEAEALVGEDEKIVYSSKPGGGVLALRLVIFNIVYLLAVIAPSIALSPFLDRIGRYLPGGTIAHIALVAAALIVAIAVSTLMWLAWQRSIYVLTPSCIIARTGILFSTVQRMPLARLSLVRQLRFGRGLEFGGS